MTSSWPRTPITWERLHPGWYEGRDVDGTLWRIVQSGSRRWEVIIPGSGPDGSPWDTLSEAKSHAETGGMAGYYRMKALRQERADARGKE